MEHQQRVSRSESRVIERVVGESCQCTACVCTRGHFEHKQ